MKKGFSQLSSTIWKLVNDQYNCELATLALFRQYAHLLDKAGFIHFSDLLEIWADDEYHHSKKIAEYLKNRSSFIEINELMVPQKLQVQTPHEIAKALFEYQKGVSDTFNNIAKNAIKENDFPTLEFVGFFLKDQIMEEKKCLDLLDAFELSKDALVIDKRVKQITKIYHALAYAALKQSYSDSDEA